MSLSKVYIALGLAVLAIPTASIAQVHTKQVLPGYQCMMLAHQWDGEGAVPPPVSVYNGPEQTAEAVGIAGGTVIVPISSHPVDGRTSMIFPDGRRVWIDSVQIVPWHAKADPSAKCRPVILPNGRYGTDGGH